jgi:hypothetical protein
MKVKILKKASSARPPLACPFFIEYPVEPKR